MGICASHGHQLNPTPKSPARNNACWKKTRLADGVCGDSGGSQACANAGQGQNPTGRAGGRCHGGVRWRWRRQERPPPALCTGVHKCARSGSFVPHMLWGLRAHMLGTHTSPRVCVYIYTDMHEGDDYSRTFTYRINSRDCRRVWKAAESAPGSRKKGYFSSALPACWGWGVVCARAPAGGVPGWPPPAPGRSRAPCLPRSPTATAVGEGPRDPSGRTQPVPMPGRPNATSLTERKGLSGAGLISLLPGKGQVDCAWPCLFSPR